MSMCDGLPCQNSNSWTILSRRFPGAIEKHDRDKPITQRRSPDSRINIFRRRIRHKHDVETQATSSGGFFWSTDVSDVALAVELVFVCQSLVTGPYSNSNRCPLLPYRLSSVPLTQTSGQTSRYTLAKFR